MNSLSARLRLFPENSTIDSAGQLCIGPHRLTDLCRQYGTPLYLYDVATIHRQIAAYREGMAVYGGSSRLTYASKAFLCAALAHLMAQAEVGFDVASLGELFIASRGGANPATMHLHGNNKSWSDLVEAVQGGVGRIVVDTPLELAQLQEIAAQYQKPLKVWLRLNPDIAIDTHHPHTVTGTAASKFGLTFAEVESLAISLINRASPIKLVGFHLHLGSHFTTAAPLYEAITILLDIAARLQQRYGWHLQELSPGGGWGVPYHPTDPDMPITPFVAALMQQIEAGCRQRHMELPTVILEPGRSLIAPAGVALYTIGGRKTKHKPLPQLSVDGGMGDNPRPALYQTKYTALLANWGHAPFTETVQIVGAYCESGDVLIDRVTLPHAVPSDILAMPMVGAYQLSMSSNYNGTLRPAVIFLDGAKVHLVQRREYLTDLIIRDLNPYR